MVKSMLTSWLSAHRETVLLASSQLLFGIVGALVVHLFFLHSSTPAIATINITGLTESFSNETTQQKQLSQADKEKRMIMFGKTLNHVVQETARKTHLVLVPSEIVMAGSRDLTQTVANQVKQEMSE